MASSISWNALPDVALVYIYRCLPDTDKLNLACACKQWCRMLAAPILWRERRVVFGSQTADRTAEKERKFIQKCGQHLRKLTLGLGTPTFKSCMLISKSVDAYVKSICNRNDVRLREIDFEHMHLEQHWHFILSRNRLISALCKLLRKQKTLVMVYLSGFRTRIHDGCRILESLAKGPSSRTITSLYMEDLFETNIFPWRQIRYVNAISKFMVLQNVHINYKYVNAEVLRNIANKLSNPLKVLSLILEGDLRGVEIAAVDWCEFTNKCPTVIVNAYLCTTILRGNDLRTPFVRGIPLVECYLTSWARSDDTEQRLAALLRHLGNLYASTMENFAMFFDRHEPVDREILYMLGRCSRVKDLCLQCRISADTVIDIMKLHFQRKLRLNSINLTIHGLSDDDWARVREEEQRLISDVSECAYVGPNDFGSGNGSSTVDDDEEDDEDGDNENLLDFGEIFAIANHAAQVDISDDEEDVFDGDVGHEDDDDGFLM